MNPNTALVNAWVFLNEDEPPGTTYTSPTSCYQTLIQNGVYQSINVLSMCFFDTLPTSATTIPAGDGSSYTLYMAPVAHKGTPLTNQDYMAYMIRDAQAANPSIAVTATLLWGDGDVISRIFANTSVSPEQNAANFAANLMAYLQANGLNGFDIDWESPLCYDTTQQQFALLVDAIGAQFRQQPEPYYLTISPAQFGNMDAAAVNANCNFVNLQLYSGFTAPSDFPGVDSQLFAYGAKFEADGPSGPDGAGYQTAQGAYDDNAANYKYGIFTNWRLNSENYVFEQQQQQALYGLVFPTPEDGES